ncbi:MAG TPA: sigma 54-interacting transcriptional regulator [Bryobacteraceae bacterium]|jgi:transcriptional regulator with AAA-type ATPase domain
MALYSDRERTVLSAIAKLAFSNPFLRERTEYEKQALQRHFVSSGPVWSASVTAPEAASSNVVRVHQRLESLIPEVRERLDSGSVTPDEEELSIYADCVQYMLYQRCHPDFVKASQGNRGTENWKFYKRFVADWRHFFEPGGKRIENTLDPAHVFACFRQFQLAFQLIFDNIIGNSMPAARLRASAWQSVFTHDLRRYHRVLFARLHDFPTLITGPSGTGKELVARAIAGSRYVPFDPNAMRFQEASQSETFLPMNLAALSPALIESELFGHKRGSFTGAITDRQGWLETCPASGSVFLDELGEMELSIQVKLLRVIETRRFSMVGDTASRTFLGKLIAATNRDLAIEIRAGRFREDLYYRLCADQIQTPSLREQIEDSPAVLDDLILFMVRRAVGDEAERCFPEVRDWMSEHLPAQYLWPGNYRELEQCVRNVIIRRSYQPMTQQPEAEESNDPYIRQILRGELTMDELTSYYAALVYGQTSSYEETARRLKVDRRTVKAKAEGHAQSRS